MAARRASDVDESSSEADERDSEADGRPWGIEEDVKVLVRY